MMLDVPYLGFFLAMIWLIFVVVIVFISLNIVRGVVRRVEALRVRVVDFFMGMMDLSLVIMWFLIILKMISFVLLEMTFQEMFTLIFVQLLPVYIIILAFKFAAYNLANETMEAEANA